MHVVVCGQIRHIACAKALLVRLARARRAGHVQAAIWVVWTNQADLAASLAAAVPEAVERLVVIDEPELTSPGHFFHQVRSLDAGLADVDPSDFVLRLRPDVFIEDDFFETVGWQMKSGGRSLWTPYADLTAPFFACDIIFGGRAGAIGQQSNYSMEPYVIALPPVSSRAPAAVTSHEPEIQRWLHPVREEDQIMQAYWSTFPSFGLATRLRRELVKRYQKWDFYNAIRLRWLDYILENVSLGGLGKGARAGLVRADDMNATECSLWLLQDFTTPASGSAQTIMDAEPGGFVWTSDLEAVGALRRSLATETPVLSDWSPRDVLHELGEIRRAAQQALLGSASEGLRLPFKMPTVTYRDTN